MEYIRLNAEELKKLRLKRNEGLAFCSIDDYLVDLEGGDFYGYPSLVIEEGKEIEAYTNMVYHKLAQKMESLLEDKLKEMEVRIISALTSKE